MNKCLKGTGFKGSGKKWKDFVPSGLYEAHHWLGAWYSNNTADGDGWCRDVQVCGQHHRTELGGVSGCLPPRQK